MSRVTVEFTEAAMAALRRGPEELAEEVQQAAVVEWYAEGRISQSKAAELLDMSRARFLEELSRRSVPAVQVEAGELSRELEWLKG